MRAIEDLKACFEETGPKLTVPEILARIAEIERGVADRAAEHPKAKAIAECLAVLRPTVKGRFPHEQALEELVGYIAAPQPVPAKLTQQEPVADERLKHLTTDDWKRRIQAAWQTLELHRCPSVGRLYSPLDIHAAHTALSDYLSAHREYLEACRLRGIDSSTQPAQQEPVLVRDAAEVLGVSVPEVSAALVKLGQWPRSTNMAISGEELLAVAAALMADQTAQPPQQEPVACKTLCELCVKHGYSFCANMAQTTPIPTPLPAQQEPIGYVRTLNGSPTPDDDGVVFSYGHNAYQDTFGNEVWMPVVHATPQPAQQEPVVFYRCNGCGHAYEQAPPTSCDCKEAGGFDRVEYYTSPPQRKPLTPREYNTALALVDIQPSLYEAVTRAVEAAHGIKENT